MSSQKVMESVDLGNAKSDTTFGNAATILQVAEIEAKEEEYYDDLITRVNEDIRVLVEEAKQLELEQKQIDDEITCLKVRDQIYQREHTELRNQLTMTRFQTTKIVESTQTGKQQDLKNLLEFEKKMDELADEFRLAPEKYNRKNLELELTKERQRQTELEGKQTAMESKYNVWCKANGLRPKQTPDTPLLDCIIPGSVLDIALNTEKNLGQVVDDLRAQNENVENFLQKEMQELDLKITEARKRVEKKKNQH